MDAVLLQIRNLAHSESVGDQTAEIPHSSYEHPVLIDAEDPSSVSPTSSTRRYECVYAGVYPVPGYLPIAFRKNCEHA